MTMDIEYGDVTLTTNFPKYIKVFSYLHNHRDRDYIEIISLYNFFSKESLKEDNKFNDDKIKIYSKSMDKKLLLYLDIKKQKICYNITIYKKTILLKINNFINSIKDFFQEKIILLSEDIFNSNLIVFFLTIAKIPILEILINYKDHLNFEKNSKSGVWFYVI